VGVVKYMYVWGIDRASVSMIYLFLWFTDWILNNEFLEQP